MRSGVGAFVSLVRHSIFSACHNEDIDFMLHFFFKKALLILQRVKQKCFVVIITAATFLHTLLFIFLLPVKELR